MKWSRSYTNYHQDVDQAPEEQGIYTIYRKVSFNNWIPIYVGKSENIRRRLKEHLEESEENACLKRYFASVPTGFNYIQVSDKNKTSGIENHIWNKLKPECNDKEPPSGKPFSDVDLPHFFEHIK